VHVAAQVDAVLDGAMHLLEMGDEIGGPLVVVEVGDAVFGDHDGLCQSPDAAEDTVQALWIDLPAKVGPLACSSLGRIGWPGPADERAAVVVDADPVQRRRRAAQDAILAEPVAEEGHRLVDRVPPAQRLQWPEGERDRHHRVRAGAT